MHDVAREATDTAPATASEHRTGSQAIERAISILNLFAGDHGELGVSEIARRTDLRISTAHRIVRALCVARFLEQDPRTERYRLGRSIALLGQRAMGHLGIELVRPDLERLVDATGESAGVGVRQGSDLLVVMEASSAQRLRFDHPIGATIRLHASAMGKAVLAFSGRDLKELVEELGPLERYTTRTITTKARLIAELESVRAIGYAVNREERYDGVSGVAAPIVDREGIARGAVGVQGPVVRLNESTVPAIATKVVDLARTIASTLPIGRW